MADSDSEHPIPEVSDHELLHIIARGSYGQVWLARNVVGTGRAVKIIARDRFQDSHPFDREFNGIQKYEPVSRSHDGLVDILQVGRNEAGGYFYYVMELADDAAEPGEPYQPRTLQSDLRRNSRLPVDECVRIGMELAEALAHLHEQGLVHRDIKPSNIIFVRNKPKLADIGLVTEADAAFSFVGTEGFIPKEGPGTAAADIYSLGKVLYEISTGLDRNQYPDLPTSFGEQADRKNLLEFNEVVVKACATDLKKRYTSARQMLDDLRLLSRGASVRRLRVLERRMAVLLRAAAVTAGLVLLVSIGFYQAHRERKAANRSLSRMLVAEGTRDMEDGDHFDALLSFSKALELDEGIPEREKAHRIRVANTLRLIPKPIGTFQHDESGVFQAHFHPNGSRLFTAGEDDKVHIWDIFTGERLHTLSHEGGLASAAYSPDGSRLVTTTTDGQATLWNADLGIPAAPPFFHQRTTPHGRIFYGFLKGTNSLNLMKTGQFVNVKENGSMPRDGVTLVFKLTGQDGGVVMEGKVLDVNGDVIVQQRYLDHPVTDTALSRANAGALSYAGARGRLELGHYAVSTNESTLIFDQLEVAQYPASSSSSPGRRMLDDFDDNRLEGWLKYGWGSTSYEVSERNGQLLIGCQGLNAPPKYAGAGSLHELFTIQEDHTLEFRVQLIKAEHADPMLIFSLEPMDQFDRILFPNLPQQTMTFSPDGHLLLSLAKNNEALLRESRTGRAVGQPLRWGSLSHLAYAPNGGRVLFSDGYSARLWDPSSHQILPARFEHLELIDSCVFTPDGRTLATVGGGQVRLWNVATADGLPFPEEKNKDITFADFSPDGRRILAVQNARIVNCLDLATGEPLLHPLRHDYPVVRCGFSPDGRRIVSLTEDSRAHLWNAVTGQPLAPSLPHLLLAGLPRFDPTGQYLLTVNRGRGAWLWDLGKMDPLQMPIPPSRLFNPMVFSPNGQFATTFEEGALLQVQDRGNGRALPFPNSGQVPPLRQVLFSADGNSLVLETREGTTRVWDVLSGAPLTAPFPTVYTVETLKFPQLDFPMNRHPAGQLMALAQFLAGYQKDNSNEPDTTRGYFRLDSWAKLKDTFPAELNFFASSRGQWHLANASQCEQDWDWWGAMFHLKQLARIEPENLNFQKRRDYAKGAWENALRQTNSWLGIRTVVPPRPLRANEAMVDLSPYYSQSIKEPLHEEQPEHTLNGLPCLIQDFGHVPFDIRGLVRLSPSTFMRATETITLPVNRPVSNIHFLHATATWAPLRAVVGHYVMHFTDGSVEEIPLVYGADVMSLESGIYDSLTPTQSSWFASRMETVLAWAGTNPWIRSQNQVLRLFRSTWKNPASERMVRGIEIRCQPEGGLLLLGITTD